MMNVVIVDDELEILNNIYEVLTASFSSGFTFHKFSSSRKAKAMLETTPVDILLTDIKMPAFSGFDLSQAAKSSNPYCRVIFLTAYDSFEYAYQALKQKCDDFILKLSPDEELVESFRKTAESLQTSQKTRKLALEGGKMRSQLLSAPVPENQNIAFIKQYIDEHWDQNLSLQMLAQMVYLHPDYVSKLFKQDYGINITKYINSVRVEHAKDLLISTDKKSQEIALSVGFESAIYFGRVFKQETGHTPMEFRQLYANLE